MKRAIFLLASLSYCFTSYAAHAAKSENTVKAAKISRADIRGQPIVLVFQNAKAPGFCMGVAGGSMDPRTPVKQGECKLSSSGSSLVHPDQRWILDPVGNTGFFQIQNENNPKMCLGVDHGRRGRADIMLGVCNSNPDQKWEFIVPDEKKPNGNDVRVNIQNSYGLCIGVERGQTTRAQLKQNTCFKARKAPDQVWVTWHVG